MTHGIPNKRSQLPFVNNVGPLARQHRLRIGLGQRKRLIHITHAFTMTASRPCFAAPLSSRHFHRPENLEIALHLLVHDAGNILVARRKITSHGILFQRYR